MHYRTLADMAAAIRANIHRIPRLPVVGIPRSGMIAASMIATLKNVPLWPLGIVGAPCLLVDDSVSGGEQMAKAKSMMPNCDLTTLAVYVKPDSPKPDIWLEEVSGPRVFEWNWAKHMYMKWAVVDIDGVLCPDGDGHDASHCLNAPLLYWPKREVLAIATGRKEDKREITEHWLAKHNIRYRRIYFSTKERGAIRTKTLAVKETGAAWVVESSIRQAEKIRDLTGRHVLCTDANVML